VRTRNGIVLLSNVVMCIFFYTDPDNSNSFNVSTNPDNPCDPNSTNNRNNTNNPREAHPY
jgi:hypothetical protein